MPGLPDSSWPSVSVPGGLTIVLRFLGLTEVVVAKGRLSIPPVTQKRARALMITLISIS